MNVQVMNITVQMAKQWIEATGDKNFRESSPNHIALLARQIRDGKWHLNGESIKLNCDGRVIDGLHRLKAIILCGIGITSVVVSGVTDEFGIDESRSRNVAQWLANKGYINASEMAASLSILRLYDQGRCESPGKSVSTRMTPEEAIVLAKRNPGIVRYVAASRHNGCLPASLLAVVPYLGTPEELRSASHMVCETAKTFIEGIKSGADLSDDDPRYMLRERMIRDKQSSSHRMNNITKRALVIIAWNKYAAGESCGSASLRWRQVGPGKQDFPQIVIADE